MTSSLCLLLLACWLLVGVRGHAVLELHMISFHNDREHLWDGSCCELFCAGQCDNLFTFCLDYTNGDDNTGSCTYFRYNTGEYRDQNTVYFSSNMRGVANPMKKTFATWPIGFKFKVNVRDDDTGHSGHDDLDRLYLRVTSVIPARSQREAGWTSRRLTGTRPRNDKTTLNMKYRVYCTPDYYGSRCATLCRAQDDDRLGHYRCDPATGTKVCNPGWEGSDCNVFSDDCHSNPCLNGATCNDGNRDYTCLCQDGYGGKNCELDIDECTSGPCQNGGQCVDRVNGYTCDCVHPYVGTNCADHVCNVTSPCQNGGTCYGAGLCHCLPQYAGATCQAHFCDFDACENSGICDRATGQCLCTPGYIGRLCDVDLCSPSVTVCENGGTCLHGNCTCPPGYTGRTCSQEVNECCVGGNEVKCVVNPCANESPCYDLVNDFECRCLPGFSGRLCNEVIPEPPPDNITRPPAGSPDVTLSPAEQKGSSTGGSNNFPIWAIILLVIIILLIVVVAIVVTLMWRYKRRAKKAEVAAGVRLDRAGYENPVYVTDTSMSSSVNTSVLTRPVSTDSYPGATAAEADELPIKLSPPGPDVVPNHYDFPPKQDNPYSMLSDVTDNRPPVEGPPVPERNPSSSSMLDDVTTEKKVELEIDTDDHV